MDTKTSKQVIRTGPYPELTLTAVLVGYFLGAVIAVSIGYAALILGLMSAFAAGERYINRVWSASTDGYRDEVLKYLLKARDQFAEAHDLFLNLQSAAAGDAAASVAGPQPAGRDQAV